MKSGLRISIRATEVPFSVPPHNVKNGSFWVFLAILGVSKNNPFWRRHTVPKQLHKSCIYFKIYFDDGIDVEVAVDIDHLGGMTSIFLNSVFESFGS